MHIKQPYVIYSDNDLKQMTTNNKEYKEARKHTLGLSWHHNDTGLNHDTVYINIDNTDFVAELIQTIVHELVHLKYPKLKHGKKFYERINRIMMS